MSTVQKPASWLTKREAADYAKVSIRTLEEWIRTGRLTVARPSAHIVRIRPEAIDALLTGEEETEAAP